VAQVAQPKSAPQAGQQTQAQSQPESTSIEPEDQTARVDKALAELNELVGIDSVKKEIQGLVNFLKVQAARQAAGLPENQISLHMVFEGNPGTGKTTVARILGRVFGAMGVLEKGHLIETDRSGLVAEYVGQTAAKANAIIDRALDGVLFIDEAYSLVAEDGKDSFGAEALQILLKRAEDDRERLIVILAGYSQQMIRMLQSNPGLSSRFSRTFGFPDYAPAELVEIFHLLADKNHYNVTPDVHARLMDQITLACKNKDEHFGNGRLVRNVFEHAIRRLADRVVDVADLTPELLTTFEVTDLEMN
jgi:SpoVK/Ycf46/Vps4 family AAA+-type ATPase